MPVKLHCMYKEKNKGLRCGRVLSLHKNVRQQHRGVVEIFFYIKKIFEDKNSMLYNNDETETLLYKAYLMCILSITG